MNILNPNEEEENGPAPTNAFIAYRWEDTRPVFSKLTRLIFAEMERRAVEVEDYEEAARLRDILSGEGFIAYWGNTGEVQSVLPLTEQNLSDIEKL